MRRITVLILLPAMAICILSWVSKQAKKKQKRKFLVTGSIMQTASYCGGARPTPEILKKLRTPAGIPFGKLYIKKNFINDQEAAIIDTIQADANGNFSIFLSAGNYCLIEEWKSKPFVLPSNSKYRTVDSACYKNLYQNCDFNLSVGNKNITGRKFILHRPCSFNQPCISYNGPLPHSEKPIH